MRLRKLGAFALSGSFLVGLGWLPGCGSEPPAASRPSAGGSGGKAPAAGAGGTGGSFTPTYMAGTGGTGNVVTAGSGGTGGDVTAGGGGSGGSAGAAGGGTGGAGAGGTGGTAGSGGSGGTPAPVRSCATAVGPDALIDDFEDSNTLLHTADGRDGSWSTYGDGTVGAVFTGTTPTASVGRSGSVGWCSSISGHTGWGADIVLKPLVPTCGYDASIYTGVCFYAKGVIDAGGPIEFGIGTGDTVPTASGGVCDPVTDCWYNYMVDLTGLTADSYQEYCFTWAELTQWSGTPVAAQHAFDPASIVQVEWKFTGRGAEAPTNGQLCIDDVRFMTAE